MWTCITGVHFVFFKWQEYLIDWNTILINCGLNNNILVVLHIWILCIESFNIKDLLYILLKSDLYYSIKKQKIEINSYNDFVTS